MQLAGFAAPQGLTWVTLGSTPWQMTSMATGHQVHQVHALEQRRREEALLAITAVQHQPVALTAAPAASSKPHRSSASAPGTNGGVSKVQAPRMSRWRRDKCRMGNLEQQVMEKRAEEQAAAQDNYRLKMRAEALEHAVAVHELQMAMLNRNMTCPSTEARNQLATKYRDFVSEASLLMLSLTEEANTPADQPVLARIADMVSDIRKAVATIYVQNPGIQFSMVSMHLDPPEQEDQKQQQQASPPPSNDHWDQVAAKVQATQAQLDEIQACWELAEEAMLKMQNEAASLSTQLEDGLQKEQACNLMELGQRLSSVTFQQAMIYFSFSYTVNARIFSPLQLARAMVHSFPYFLDTKQLVASLLRTRRPSQTSGLESMPSSSK